VTTVSCPDIVYSFWKGWAQAEHTATL
jgi:hypothetical protein